MTPKQVIDHYGGQRQAAQALKITRQCVNYWLHSGKIPPRTQAWIQFLTGDKLKVSNAK